MLKSLVISCIAVFVFAGCASVTPVQYQYTGKYFPDIGSVETEELGSTLLSYIYVAEIDSYRIVKHLTSKKTMRTKWVLLPQP